VGGRMKGEEEGRMKEDQGGKKWKILTMPSKA
jgi:hypothetical protein